SGTLRRPQRITWAEQPSVARAASKARLQCAGPWTAASLVEVEQSLRSMRWPEGGIELDLWRLSALDIPGAWLLHRTTRELGEDGREVRLTGVGEGRQKLLDLVAEHIS